MATSNVQISEEQLTRFTGYPVALPAFEGPLDLLLFLIRRQQIDIYDIPIARITAQFLDYLALMEHLDIEIAADFLVMAATLLEIKSRMLLPRPPVEILEGDEEDNDPRAELTRKLLEYQQYKQAAGDLLLRAEEQRKLFSRTAVVPNLAFERPDPLLAGNTDAFSLWQALQEVLARVEAAGPSIREVMRPKITIRHQMMHILKMLDGAPQGITFADLIFYPGRSDTPSRGEVILTFLAMLELMRLHRIRVSQATLFGGIKLVLMK